MAVKNQKTIEIEDFIDLDALSPIYFEKPYYLLPTKRGEKGYVLLRETLRHTKKVGIASIIIHTHQYLAVIIPYGSALIVNTIRYPEEIISPSEVALPTDPVKNYKISKKEFDIAEQLVNTMSVKWEPKHYKNHYRDEVMKVVEEKIKSRKKGSIKRLKRPNIKQTNVIDFMDLLKKSVKNKQKRASKRS